MDLAAALGEINCAHGSEWSLGGALDGGWQQGAYEVVASGGTAVLKLGAGRGGYLDDTATLVAELRRRGWPTPSWLAHGYLGGDHSDGYLITERVEGSRPPEFTEELCGTPLSVLKLQRGIGRVGGNPWSEVPGSVFASDSSTLQRLLAFSVVTAQLADRVSRLVEVIGPVELTTADAVHGDFGPDNMLVNDEGQLVAIVDVDSLGVGDATLDLATLVQRAWAWGADVRHRLLDEAITSAGVTRAVLTIAAQVTVVNAFGISHWPTDLDWYVKERYSPLLAELEALVS